MLGGTELLVIAVVIILLFGGSQLPKLAKSLGRFITEFNEAKDDAEEALQLKKSARKAKRAEK